MRSAGRSLPGLLLGLGLLWLLFRGTDGAALAAALGEVDVGWLVVAQGLLWAVSLVRVQRWAYVVRAVQPASFRHLLSATQIGLLTNYTVPARLGDLARAWVLSRLVQLPIARALAMVTLDRVNDVIGLLTVVFVAGLALGSESRAELPPGTFGNAAPIGLSAAVVSAAASALAGGALAASLGLILFYARREQVLRSVRGALGWASERLAGRTVALLGHFADGLDVLRSRADLARAVVWSILGWLTDTVAVAAILAAFGIAFPWYAPFVVMALVAVSTAVPVAPGVVGQFHVAAVAGLLLAVPELEPTRAKAVAIVAHLSNLVPIAALGAWCLFRERLGLAQVVGGSAAAGESSVRAPRG
jgi:hypothetical protein